MYKTIGIDFLDPNTKVSYTRAISALEQNLRSYPKFQKLLKYSMESLRIVFVFSPLKTPKEVEVPQKLKKAGVVVETLVFYDKYFGGILNAKLFNNLPALSQSGVWVHEALRRLQLVYHFPISNLEMLKLTSASFSKELKAEGIQEKPETKILLAKIENELPEVDARANILFLVSNHFCNKEEKGIDDIHISTSMQICQSQAPSSIEFIELVHMLGNDVVAVDVKRGNFLPGTTIRKYYDDKRDELTNIQFDLMRESTIGMNIWDNFPEKGSAINIPLIWNEYIQLRKYQDPGRKDDWYGIENLKNKINKYLSKKYLQ